eukprot:jgi/Mesvir1/2172/Mv16682-RA.1
MQQRIQPVTGAMLQATERGPANPNRTRQRAAITTLQSQSSGTRGSRETNLLVCIDMETIVEGDKKTVPRPGQRVSIHYKGSRMNVLPSGPGLRIADSSTSYFTRVSQKLSFLPSGAVFDTTLVDGKEASFVVGDGAVIRALDECVQKTREPLPRIMAPSSSL